MGREGVPQTTTRQGETGDPEKGTGSVWRPASGTRHQLRVRVGTAGGGHLLHGGMGRGWVWGSRGVAQWRHRPHSIGPQQLHLDVPLPLETGRGCLDHAVPPCAGKPRATASERPTL